MRRTQLFSVVSFLSFMFVFLYVLPAGAATDPGKEDAAVASARLFLEMVDRGEYAESWAQASSLFAERIPKEEWIEGISRFRPTFGTVQERVLKGSHVTRSLPGAPDGEYVLILFLSVFEKKASAVETITMMLDDDGRWRTAGYYIE